MHSHGASESRDVTRDIFESADIWISRVPNPDQINLSIYSSVLLCSHIPPSSRLRRSRQTFRRYLSIMSQTLKAADVAAHNKANDLWVIVDEDVYDLTEFQEEHPGGKKSRNNRVQAGSLH